MKKFLLALYATVISAFIITLMYLVAPYVVENPKISTIILVLLLFSTCGVVMRSMIEIGVLKFMVKIADGKSNSFLICPIVFAVGMLAAIAIPWSNGISDFSTWNWISSITFTLFNFETFYAFIGATRRMYGVDNETENAEY